MQDSRMLSAVPPPAYACRSPLSVGERGTVYDGGGGVGDGEVGSVRATSIERVFPAVSQLPPFRHTGRLLRVHQLGVAART